MKWDCKGIKEDIQNIKDFLNTSRKADKSFIAYKRLKALDNVITSLMEDDENDIKCLFTCRHKVRLLIKSIVK